MSHTSLLQITSIPNLPADVVATDASLIDGDKPWIFYAGAAFLDAAGNWKMCGWRVQRAPEVRSALVMQYELRAIDKALRFSRNSVLILSDSKAAITMLKRWRVDPNAPVPSYRPVGKGRPALEVLAYLFHREQDRVNVQWQRAHVGHPLNEEANALARLASHAVRDAPWSRVDLLARGEAIAARYARQYRLGAA